MSEMVGGSLTGLTVRKNALLEDKPVGSLTVIVTVTVPFWLAAGTRVTVRLEALPPKLMAESGNNEGFDEAAVSVNCVAGLWAEPMVKGTRRAASSLTLVLARREMNGRAFCTVSTKELVAAPAFKPGPSRTTTLTMAEPS